MTATTVHRQTAAVAELSLEGPRLFLHARCICFGDVRRLYIWVWYGLLWPVLVVVL